VIFIEEKNMRNLINLYLTFYENKQGSLGCSIKGNTVIKSGLL